LKSNPSDLPPDLRDAIDSGRDRFGPLASEIHFFPTLGSTDDAAATLPVEGAVVIADEQTAGRGRRGHTWFSPAGSGLYVSLVLMPSRARVEPARATSLLTLAAGV